VLKACHCHVALPSINYASYNVAVAGSLVMYDRVLKQVWGGAKAKRDRGVSTPSPWRRRKEGLDAPLDAQFTGAQLEEEDEEEEEEGEGGGGDRKRRTDENGVIAD
jgi:hypothetical protein